MNLTQKVDQLFASSSPAEIAALLQKARFDEFNKVGVDILSPQQAAEQADSLRNTFESVVIPEFTYPTSAHAWCFDEATFKMAGEVLFISDGSTFSQISSLYSVAPTDCAGKTEQAPLAA